jgi:RNA polymerase sigma factor (sigma-70 family)
MALYTSRHIIKDADKLPNWLASTAFRRAMRIHRNRYTREKIAENSIVGDSPVTPDEHLTLIERRKILEEALEKLDERCRILLHTLFFALEDESYDKLAKKLRIPLNSLGPTRKRCLGKLKILLKDFDEIWY